MLMLLLWEQGAFKNEEIGNAMGGYRHNAGQFDPVMRVLQYLSLHEPGGSEKPCFKGCPGLNR